MIRSKSLFAGAAALALLMAGCGDDDDGGSTGSTGGLEGEPIKLLQITVPEGGAGFAGFPHTAQATQVAVTAINEAGGVDGRPLQVDICDDQFDPNKAGECGRQAVSGDYIAVVGAYSGVGDVWMPILEDAGIPCIGCAGYSSAELQSPMFFPLGPGGAISTLGGASTACALGVEHPVVVAVDNPSASFLADQFARGLAPCGLESRSITISQGGADFAPQATDALEGGTDYVSFVIGQPDDIKFAQALDAAGGSPIINTAEESYGGEAYLEEFGPLAENLIFNSATVPTYVDDPRVEQLNAEFDEFAEDDSLRRSDSVAIAWSAVHILADIIADNPDAAESSDALVDAMTSAGTIEFGPVPPFDWSQPIEAFAPLRVFTTQGYAARPTGDGATLEPVFEGGFFDQTTIPTPVS
jgi:ABC-type branched-subunit amino acid transport system substrate-binding protein